MTGSKAADPWKVEVPASRPGTRLGRKDAGVPRVDHQVIAAETGGFATVLWSCDGLCRAGRPPSRNARCLGVLSPAPHSGWGLNCAAPRKALTACATGSERKVVAIRSDCGNGKELGDNSPSLSRLGANGKGQAVAPLGPPIAQIAWQFPNQSPAKSTFGPVLWHGKIGLRHGGARQGAGRQPLPTVLNETIKTILRHLNFHRDAPDAILGVCMFDHVVQHFGQHNLSALPQQWISLGRGQLALDACQRLAHGGKHGPKRDRDRRVALAGRTLRWVFELR